MSVERTQLLPSAAGFTGNPWEEKEEQNHR